MKKSLFIQIILLLTGLAFSCSSVKNASSANIDTKKVAPEKKEAKKIMLMNRIGPSVSELFIANADGTNEHKLFEKSGFDLLNQTGKDKILYANSDLPAEKAWLLCTRYSISRV